MRSAYSDALACLAALPRPSQPSRRRAAQCRAVAIAVGVSGTAACCSAYRAADMMPEATAALEHAIQVCTKQPKTSECTAFAPEGCARAARVREWS
jgi:hypothetical protein